MNRVKLYAIVMGAVLLLLAFTAVSAEAGKPRYKYAGQQSSFEKPIVVDNSTTAFSYYAELVSGESDIYQVYAIGGEPAQISLAAPKSDDLKGFTPSLALIGPGITTNVDTNTLPVSLPEGMGAIVLNYTGDLATRPEVSDPATMTGSWQGQEYKAVYPKAGPYYILIWDKQGRGGKYIMTVGTQDDFGLFDLIKFPYTWAKLNIWFGNWVNLLVAVLLLAAVVFAAVWLIGRRRRRTA
jgi:hypothetical protein